MTESSRIPLRIPLRIAALAALGLIPSIVALVVAPGKGAAIAASGSAVLAAAFSAWTGRLAGEGTIDQVLDDLAELRLLGADTVVLDPFSGDPGETLRPEDAWQSLSTVRARVRHLREQP